MRKIIVLALLSMFLLCGCTSKGDSLNGFTQMNASKIGTMIVSDYIDEDTGVHYICVSGGGICPRYNADGSLMVESEE